VVHLRELPRNNVTDTSYPGSAIHPLPAKRNNMTDTLGAETDLTNHHLYVIMVSLQGKKLCTPKMVA